MAFLQGCHFGPRLYHSSVSTGHLKSGDPILLRPQDEVSNHIFHNAALALDEQKVFYEWLRLR